MAKVFVAADDGAVGSAGVLGIDVVNVVGLGIGLEERLNVSRRVWFRRYLSGISKSMVG